MLKLARSLAVQATVVLLGGLCCEAPVSAATYFVRKTGSDSNAGTTATAAFQTIGKAVLVASNGDTVYVGPGTYSESGSVQDKNSSAEPLQFVADTSGAMTGDSPGAVVIPSSSYFYVENSRSIQLYGFTLLGTLEWRSSSWDGLLHGCTRTGSSTSLKVIQASLTLRECTITNTSTHAVYVDDATSKLYVEKSTISGNSVDAIHVVKAAVCTVQDSVISNNGEHGIEASSDSSSHKLSVYRCRIFGNTLSGIYLPGTIAVEVHSTLVHSNRTNGIFCNGNSAPITVINCTIADNTDDGIDFFGGTLTVKNTILANNGSYWIRRRSGTVNRTYNLYYSNGYALTFPQTGEITGNPAFVGGGDYHLGAGSMAIDRGTDAGVDIDLDGLFRHGATEIGAYEYSGVPPTYYVRISGQDSNSGTSPSSAWKTIAHAMAQVPPGAIVRVGAGTYQESAVISADGNQDRPTTVVADTTGSATGDAGAIVVVPGLAGRWSWRIAGAQHVSLQGFRFAGGGLSPGYGLNISESSGVLLEDCAFEQTNHGLSAAASTITLNRCEFRNNTDRSLTSNLGQLVARDCQFIGNEVGPWSDHDSLLTIENTTISGQTDWGAVIIGPRNSLATAGPEYARLVNTTLHDNQNGVRLGNITPSEVTFSGTVIRNSRAWALGLYDSVVTLNSSTPAAWPLENNNSGIFSYNTQLTVHDYPVEDYTAGYGLAAQLGTVQIDSCRVANNLFGLSMQDCTQFSAQNCDFSGNLEFGLVVKGKANLQNCRFDANKNGIQLNQTDDIQVQLVNTTISNSQQYGVQAVDSQFVFDASTAGKWQLTANGHGVAGLRSNLTFSGFTLSGQLGAAVHSTNGRVVINGSTFSGNGIGVSSNQDTQFVAADSSFTGNSQWGAQLSGSGSFTRCQIATNQLGGLWLQGLTDGNLQLSETTLSDNGTYGVYADQCRLTFDPSNRGQYVISGSDYTFAGNQSELVFDRVTIAGGDVAAVLATGGTLLASNATFSASNYGLMVYDASSFTAVDTQFSDNRLYGLYLQGPGQLQDCTLQANGQGGLFLYRTQTGDVRLANTLITGNLEHGIRAEQCQMTVDDNFVSLWQVTGNPTAIYSSQSDLTIEGLAFTESSGYAIRAVGGQLAVRHSTLSNNGAGLHCQSLTSLTVADCILSDNRSWAVTAYGPLNLVNTRVSNNVEGVWLGTTTDDQVVLSNSQITDNENSGLYLHESTLVFDPARQGSCVIERNGAGITAWQSHLTLSDYTVRANGYGVGCYQSDVLVERSTFTQNETGLYGSENTSLVVRNATFEQNSSAGAHLATIATLTDTTFRNNGCGLLLEGRSADDVQFANCQIVDNTGDGLRAVACTLAFGASDQTALRITGNGRGITGNDSTLRLDGYSVSGNTQYGVAAYGGTLELANLSLSGNGSGLLLYRANSASLVNARLHENGDWGAVVHVKEGGAATTILEGSQIDHNGNGLYLAGAVNGSLELPQTVILDNSGYGLYVATSTLTLECPIDSPWQIAGNGVGLGTDNSQLSLSGVQFEDSQTYGLMALNSNVNMVQTCLSGPGSGIYGAASDLAVDRCQLQGGGGSEQWGVLSYDSRTSLRNTTVVAYGNGIYVEAASTADSVEVQNVTLAGTVRDGIYQNGGALTVQNSIISGSSARYGLARVAGQMNHSHNLISGFGSSHHQTALAPSELVKSPRFQDAANGDFRLAVGSPAINAGTDLSGLYQHDLEGTARPTYQAFEIGAYEYLNPNGSLRVLSWSEQR